MELSIAQFLALLVMFMPIDVMILVLIHCLRISVAHRK